MILKAGINKEWKAYGLRLKERKHEYETVIKLHARISPTFFGSPSTESSPFFIKEP